MSSTSWENVYIFISSTFNDMHAERDYLVKRVFPELSEWCAARRLRLMDIDLRWGVTEKDSQENKRVVDVCLSGIDRCRPLFLCFLGQRRGWVPDKNDIAETTFADFPKLKQYLGSSVTEMEIIHAIIDPMMNGAVLDIQNRERAFFYCRDGAYLSDITNQAVRNIYSNDGEPDPSGADQKLHAFQETIRNTGRPLHTYTAHWDRFARTPELLSPGRDASVADGRLTGFVSEGMALSDVILEELKAAITELYPGRETSKTLTLLQKELDEQAVFRQTALEGFIEREGDFDPVRAYLTDDDRRPMALCAQAGMGKTSYLAQLSETLSQEDRFEVLSRFIGTSENSVSLGDLLTLIAQELRDRFSLSNVPDTAQKIRDNFYSLLSSAVKNSPLVLIIDAVNQLDSGLSDLSWIPEILPENVKLIVSFKLGDPDGDALFKRITEDGSMRTHTLKGFDDRASRAAIVKQYLSRYLKELDEREIETIISLEGASNPLYLKILLSELKVYGSFEGLHALITTQFGNTASEAFDGLLRRIETDPGYSPVPAKDLAVNVFGWLSHSKNGLQTDELADLLVEKHYAATPEDAKDSVSLILRQLRPFLAKRDKRHDFFYESFLLAAKNRYSRPENGGRPDAEWHRELAEYFRKRNFADVRKLSEQAYQAAHAGMDTFLRSLLLTYNYLERRVYHTGLSQLLDDYSLVTLPTVQIPEEEKTQLLLIRDALEQSASVVSQGISQLAVQLCGRLDGFDLPLIRSLLDNTWEFKEKYKVPWLRPLCTFLSPPGSRIIRYFKTLTHVACMFKSRQKLVLYESESKAIQVIEVRTGRVLRSYPFPTVSPPMWLCLSEEKNTLAIRETGRMHFLDLTSGRTYQADGVTSVPLSPREVCGDLILTTGMNKAREYYISRISTGELLYHIHPEQNDSSFCLCFDPVTGHLLRTVENEGIAVLDPSDGLQQIGMYRNLPEHIRPGSRHTNRILVSENSPFIITMTEFDGLTVYDRDTGNVRYHEIKSVPSLYALSGDGKLLVLADMIRIYVYSLDTFEKIQTINTARRSVGVSAVTLSKDNRTLFVCRDSGLIELFDMKTGDVICEYAENHSAVEELFINETGDRMVSFNKGEVILWDLEKEHIPSDPGLSDMQIASAALSPDDRFLIVSTKNSECCVYRIEIPSMERRKLVEYPTTRYLAPDSAIISTDAKAFAIRKDLNILLFYDSDTGEKLGEIHAVDSDNIGEKEALRIWNPVFLPKEAGLGERGLTVLYRQNGNIVIQDPDVPEKTEILRVFDVDINSATGNSYRLFDGGTKLAVFAGDTVYRSKGMTRKVPVPSPSAKIYDLKTLTCLEEMDDPCKAFLQSYEINDRPAFVNNVISEYRKTQSFFRMPQQVFRTKEEVYYYSPQPSNQLKNRFSVFRSKTGYAAFSYINEGPQYITGHMHTSDGCCYFIMFSEKLCPFRLENKPE